MTIATLMGTGTLRSREGRSVRVKYLLENSPDLLSLGPSQQPGTLVFPEGETALIHEPLCDLVVVRCVLRCLIMR
jgi:hypothetical protein